MKFQMIVSAFLSGIGKASGQPVRLLIMVRMCWFPDVKTFRSMIKLMAILSKGQSGIPVICKGYICGFAFSLLHRVQFVTYLRVFVHPLPIILSLNKVVSPGDSLMT